MIAVVIPAHAVREHILEVIGGIGPEVERIYVVDDACPEGSGDQVESACDDMRVKVLRHPENRGVGGATLTGYAAAIEDGARVIVKLDGDGQMDPAMIGRLVAPILDGEADYTKGNRFYDRSALGSMPVVRMLGNTALSFLTKLSSGYWNIFDPTNGYTAIHAKVAAHLPSDRISQRWFFESDMLYHLGILRCVVCDIPMTARYGEEKSSLIPSQVLLPFARNHVRNTLHRLFYSYYLRDFNIASIELLLGPLMLIFGTTVGATHWRESIASGQLASSGTVMLSALPVILGAQLVLAFLGFDLHNIPQNPIHRRL